MFMMYVFGFKAHSSVEQKVQVEGKDIPCYVVVNLHIRSIFITSNFITCIKSVVIE